MSAFSVPAHINPDPLNPTLLNKQCARQFLKIIIFVFIIMLQFVIKYIMLILWHVKFGTESNIS